MTAEEIRNHQFESLTEDSYSKESVDAYISEIGKAYEELYNENKEIVRRLTIFAKKIDEYKRNENYMTETLLTAQKTAAQTISGAEAVVAKMIEAAKNEGRKIVNEARERSNAIYADRDKIIADAQKVADELTEKASNAYEEARAEAEKQMQSAIDEINDSADSVIRDAEAAGEKIIEEAKAKAQTIADGIIANAETLRNESFEMKKLAVLYKDEVVAKASEEAELQRQEAGAFARSVTSKAKTVAAGILLKAQADVNRINDELSEKTEAANSALATAQERYFAVKAVADEVFLKFSSQLADFNTALASVPVENELPDIVPSEVNKAAFVSDSEALNAAVANEDIDAVLRCFGINPDDMMKATERIIAAEAEKIKTETPAKNDNNEKPEDVADNSDAVTAAAPEPTAELPESEESIESAPEIAESPEESVPAEEPQNESAQEPEDLQSDGIEDDFNFDFQDAERIPEAGEAVDYIDDDEPEQVQEQEDSADEKEEIVDDFSIDADALFDDNWDDISDADVSDDDVKEFVPEIPGENSSETRFILDDSSYSDETPDDDSADDGEPETANGEMIDDSFEIDFSMFEVDEEKKKEQEPKSANKNAKKKKKKRK